MFCGMDNNMMSCTSKETYKSFKTTCHSDHSCMPMKKTCMPMMGDSCCMKMHHCPMMMEKPMGMHHCGMTMMD
jgi:hypothetical protein